MVRPRPRSTKHGTHSSSKSRGSKSNSHHNIDGQVRTSGHYNCALHSIDKCHNNDVPCCNAIREIVMELFPDVTIDNIDISKDEPGIHTSKAKGTEHSHAKHQHQHHDDEEHGNTKNGKIGGGKATKNNTSGSTLTAAVKPTLLSQILRKYLLEERQTQMESSSSTNNTNTNNTNTNNNNNGQKKKRKKKKKKQSNNAASIPASSSANINVNDNGNNVINNNLSATISLPTCNGNSGSSGQGEYDILTSKKIENNPQFENINNLNCLLDNLVIQDNQPTPTSAKSNTTIATVPTNRNLKSLFEYIQTRYQDFNPTTSEYPHSHSHSHSSSQKNSKTMPIRSSRTPTIPFQELSDLICTKIKCIHCKRHTEQYLGGSNFNSFNSSTSSIAASFRKGRDNQQQEQKETSKICSIQMDANSIMIPPPQQQQQQQKKSTLDIPGPYGITTTTTTHHQQHHPYSDVEQQITCDYVALDALEEGNGVANQNGYHHDSFTSSMSMSSPSSLSKSSLTLNVVMVNQTDTKFIELDPSECPFTLTKFINLVKDIIIPCGLHELQQFKPSSSSSSSKNNNSNEEEEKNIIPPPSSETIIKIQTKYQTFMNELLSHIKSFQTILSQNEIELQSATQNSTTVGNFNIKTSNILRECESKQHEYIQEYRSFLRKIHISTIYGRVMNPKHVEQKFMNDLVEKLWMDYDDTVRLFVEPSLEYLWKVIQCANNSTGVIPSAYVCSVRRGYQIEMLKKKSLILKELQNKMEMNLILSSSSSSCLNANHVEYRMEASDVEVRNSNLARLVSLATYCSWINGDKDIEKMCEYQHETSVSMLHDLVCNTTCQSEKSEMIKVQSERMGKVRDTVKELGIDIVGGNFDIPKSYEASWLNNNIFIEENMMKDDLILESKVESTFDTDKSEMYNICGVIQYVGKQFRLYADINASKNLANETAAVDTDFHKLPQWIEEIRFRDYNKEKLQMERGCKDDDDNWKCEGGGKRRVMCILSACLYSWVQERCVEWHADLLHEELLMDANEEFALANKTNNGSQRSKKSKKKKKKGSAKQEVTVSAIDVKGVKSLETVQTSNIIEEQNECEREDGDTNISSSEPQHNETEEGSRPNSPIEDVDESEFVQVDCSEENSYDITDYNVNVSVVDGSTLISAEDYLCNRFFNILKNEDVIIL